MTNEVRLGVVLGVGAALLLLVYRVIVDLSHDVLP
jgi:hypothetical protein